MRVEKIIGIGPPSLASPNGVSQFNLSVSLMLTDNTTIVLITTPAQHLSTDIIVVLAVRQH